jgi:hypothetical protein
VNVRYRSLDLSVDDLDYDIKIDLKEIEFGNMCWIHLAVDRSHWRDLVMNAVINL